MAKISAEICMISARGLPRSSSFWKLQWFAVGWIDPNNNYCSKIDNSGSSNPTWRTKFSVCMDDAELNRQSMALTVEVHSRDAVFLREKLHGTVTIPLKEFLVKFSNDPDGWRSDFEEVGSFQLRRKNSGKPRGFVDVSVRISEKRMENNSHSGRHKGPHFPDMRSGISMAIEDGKELVYPVAPRSPTSRHFGDHNTSYHDDLPHAAPRQPELGGRVGSSSSATSYPQDHQAVSPCEQKTSLLPPHYQNYGAPPTDNNRPTPPPPPPPSNTGFIPSFFPTTGQLPGTYTNLPPARKSGPNTAAHVAFGTGVGAGALAAGAVIFGDDFMSNSNLPTGFG